MTEMHKNGIVIISSLHKHGAFGYLVVTYSVLVCFSANMGYVFLNAINISI